MNPRDGRRGIERIAALLLAALSATTFACAASADPSPAARSHLGPIRAPSAPVRTLGQDHEIFGEIAKLAKPFFTLRIRSGRILEVDASRAIATDEYSAPLFVGKLVVVKGKLDARGIIHADTVTRITHIDTSTAQDR
jgi:hypothetical protein